MTLYSTLKGTHKKQADKILKHSADILGGTLLAIDPSSTSMGWALFEKGQLADAGVAKGDGPIGERLQQIYEMLPDAEPNVIVTELVRTSTGHYFLTWSNGAMLARYGPPVTLEVSTNLWKKITDDTYYKSDVVDAKMIGKLVITLCKEAEENEHS